MNSKLKKLILKDIEMFEQTALDFEAGEIDRKTYKGISGGFGSYAQRTTGAMLRLRMAGGRLTKNRLAFLAACVNSYHVNLMKLTTCQTIQLHNLDVETTVDLMRKALDVDIVTRGGGGDYPRNVMVSPLSGVEQGEYFDVMPWAEQVGDYLLSLVRDIHLPRKLKIAFSNSPANVTHATFRDLGFAAREDGNFDVYCAGGLGPNPKIGVKVAEKIAPENILACVDAMIHVFTTFGNYENRGKARTRYLQESLGVDGLKSEYRKALEEKLVSSKKLSPVLTLPNKKPDGEITHPRAIPQKQLGLYAVSYHPIGGILPVEMPEKLYQTIKDMPQVECRISPDGTLYIINLTACEAKSVLDFTSDSAKTPFECSVSCIGSTICQQGIRDSQGLLAKMVQAVREAGLPANALPKLCISGCPSSCGTQQSSAIGFQGTMKLVEGKSVPAFNLLFKGNKRQGEENLGKVIGSIVEDQIPEFIVKVGKMVADSGVVFYEWIERCEDVFLDLAMKYINV